MESLTKRPVALVLVLMLISNFCLGQTWDELFKQRKTQLRYSLQQIAALKVYAGYLKKGYEIVGSGLKTVKDITNGEFNLHSTFINALKTVNPVIRKDSRIAETIALQIETKKAFNYSYADRLLSSSNQTYIADVKEKVLEECQADLDELILIITSGKIEMSDNERLNRLEKVYQSTKQKSQFTQQFSARVNLLIRQRENEQQSVNLWRMYYEKE